MSLVSVDLVGRGGFGGFDVDAPDHLVTLWEHDAMGFTTAAALTRFIYLS